MFYSGWSSDPLKGWKSPGKSKGDFESPGRGPFVQCEHAYANNGLNGPSELIPPAFQVIVCIICYFRNALSEKVREIFCSESEAL